MSRNRATIPSEIVDVLAGRNLPPNVGESAVSFALEHELESLLISTCAAQGVEINSERAHELHAKALFREGRSTRALSATADLLSLAEKIEVPVAIFKGPALGLAVYDRVSSRPFNDIDVLVGPAHPASLDEFLQRLGRSQNSSAALVELASKGRPVHEVSGALGQTDFDVHFNPFGLITPLREPLTTWEQAVASSVELPDGTVARTPSPELHLLICLINLCRRGGGALRFYADSSRLLASNGFDWNLFNDVAAKEGLTRIAGQALLALQQDLAIEIGWALPTKREWWAPAIGEPPNADSLHRRAPLLTMRLSSRRTKDLRDLGRWYLPNQLQRDARAGEVLRAADS